MFVSICADEDIYLEEALFWMEKVNKATNWKEEFLLDGYTKLLGKSGDFKKAIEIGEKVEKISGSKPNYMSIFYFKAGEVEKGKILFEEVKSSNIDNGLELYILAKLFFDFNVNLNGALDCLKRAIELYRGDRSHESLCLGLYAEIQYVIGDVESARQFAKEAYKISNDYKYKIFLDKLY